MAMIKRAKTGTIDEVIDEEGNEQTIPWEPKAVIKDVLEVPTRSETKVDVDLDDDDEDEIAVRV